MLSQFWTAVFFFNHYQSHVSLEKESRHRPWPLSNALPLLEGRRWCDKQNGPWESSPQMSQRSPKRWEGWPGARPLSQHFPPSRHLSKRKLSYLLQQMVSVHYPKPWPEHPLPSLSCPFLSSNMRLHSVGTGDILASPCPRDPWGRRGPLRDGQEQTGL